MKTQILFFFSLSNIEELPIFYFCFKITLNLDKKKIEYKMYWSSRHYSEHLIILFLLKKTHNVKESIFWKDNFL